MDAEDAERERARQQAEREGDFNTIVRQVIHQPHAAVIDGTLCWMTERYPMLDDRTTQEHTIDRG